MSQAEVVGEKDPASSFCATCCVIANLGPKPSQHAHGGEESLMKALSYTLTVLRTLGEREPLSDSAKNTHKEAVIFQSFPLAST